LETLINISETLIKFLEILINFLENLIHFLKILIKFFQILIQFSGFGIKGWPLVIPSGCHGAVLAGSSGSGV
jgi:hypothetical protein